MAHLQTQSSPAVGEPAPSFTLKNSDMKPVSLDELRGRTVILAFFPAAFSSVCTDELCSFHKHMRDLNEINARVLGISVDLPYTLREFRRTQGISFPLLSDFDREVIQRYGVFDDDYQGYRSGVAQRSVFILGPDGTVAWRWISEDQGQHPDYADVYTAAEELSR